MKNFPACKELKIAYHKLRTTSFLQETEDGIEWARLDVPYTCCIKSPKKESKLKGLKSYIAYQITPSVSSLPEYRAYPGSEFVVANPLANWKKLSQMKLTLAKVLARKVYQNVYLYLTLCLLGATKWPTRI